MDWFAGIRARLQLFFGRRAAEARMDEEIALHIEMETGRLVREQGRSPEEARRQALVAFGGVERHKAELRDGRGLSWLTGISLDFRLAFRMLMKYPGLTVVGVTGMAVAVALGAAAFGIVYTFVDTSLPLDDGDRVVAIENVDPTSRANGGRRTHLHDLAIWREELTAIDALGAYRTVDRNLIIPGGQPGSARIAEMTASGFRIARVRPLLGRSLLDSDERKGAPPVAVIGHSIWQRRFAGASDIIGRTLQLGATQHTIVGVMPDGFGFPINNRVWTPLQLEPVDFARGEAPIIQVFGRLAPGATLDDARTQLTTIARRLAAEHPDTHSDVRTRVFPYSLSAIDGSAMKWMFHLVQLLISMLLVLIGTNVAILVYARTVGRAGEIAVRSALGASRGRIVAQLFAEALVLSSAAAAVGLVFARFALVQLDAFVTRMFGEQVPFWISFDISLGVVLYAAGLAILAAMIVGVVPALAATRHPVHAGLQQLGIGGSSMRLGRVWTALIVAQVAAAVGVLPVSFELIGFLIGVQTAKPAYATEGLLAASVRLDREGFGTDDFDAYEAQEFRARLRQRQAELVRRLEAEPGVENVVLMDGLPGGDGGVRIEIDRPSAERDTAADSAPRIHSVAHDRVDPDYFDVFEIPLLAGRRFGAADVSASANVAIVSRAFAERILGGDPLGRSVRRVVEPDENDPTTARSEPWYEIVGVVGNVTNAYGDGTVRMYQPLLPGAAHPVRLVIRVQGADAASFAGRLREVGLALDPMLRLGDVRALDAGVNDNATLLRWAFLGIVGVTTSVLLLSAAGIYALMSFTVTRLRREIGIRSALGARPHLLVGGVLSKAAGQIAVGILVGLVLARMLTHAGGNLDYPVLRLLLVAAFMMVVGMVAAFGPARRALRIQPTEALRSE